MKTATNSEVISEYVETKILLPGNKKHEIKLRCLKELSPSIILGIDALVDMDAHMDYKTCKIWLKGIEFSFSSSDRRIMSLEDVDLPPKGVRLVKVAVQSAGLIKSISPEYTTLDSMIDQGKGMIPVYNKTDLSVVLKKDQNIFDTKRLVKDEDDSSSEMVDSFTGALTEDEIIKNLIEDYRKSLASYDEKQTKVRLEHKINIENNTQVKHKNNYRFGEEKLEFVQKQTISYLKDMVIEESTSRWNSPIIIVPKKEGYRTCIDYRDLNKVTIKEICPPPNIEECLDVLGKGAYFSQLDLKDGYHQIAIERNSRELTAFTTPLGKFQFRKMPFGLTNAPSTFQNIMYVILQKLIYNGVVVYMDDIIVYSKSKNEHYELLEKVLRCLSNYNLKLNFNRCTFLAK